MHQSRSKCNIFGQARIPGDLPLRELVGATLCEAVSKLLEFNPFFILFCLSSIYVVKKRVNIDPLLQKIIAKRIDIDPLLQEIIAKRVNVDPLLQEITAKRVNIDPLLQEITAKRIDIDPLLQEITAGRINVDTFL